HTVEHQALHLSRTMCLFYLWTSSTTQRYRPDRWSCWAFHNTGPPMRDGLKGESEGAAGNLSQNSGCRAGATAVTAPSRGREVLSGSTEAEFYLVFTEGGEDERDVILTNFGQRRCVDRLRCSF